MDREWQLAFFKDLKERFTQLERKVSIIIQGPLNHRSIEIIPEYLKRGEVIVSCWDSDDISSLDEYKDQIKIVVNKYSDVSHCYKTSGSQAPWVYQHHTTLNGLLKAKNHFSIKVRSDESYPDLDPLINMLIKQNEERDPQTNEYEDRIITSNIYFRRDGENKFHPSDHIVSGRTQRMIDAFKKAKLLSSMGTANQRFPEQLLCKAIIESKFLKGERSFDTMREGDSAEQMKQYFNIIRISELKDRIWTSSYRKYDALFGEEDWCHDINSI